MLGRSRNIRNHGAGNAVACLSLILVVCLCLVCLVQPVRAGILTSGNVIPADPSTWTSSTTGYIGRNTFGTMNITNGSDVIDYYGYIGYSIVSTGEVTVDGAGSTWTNSSGLYVGYNGSGMLNITDTGVVTVGWKTLVAPYSGSSGTIHFDNGTLTTGGFLCDFDDLTGTGTIHTHGLVSDVDLLFDATHGLNQTFNINDNPGQNITVNLNVDGSSLIGAGFSGAGTMSISNGSVIESTEGYISYKSGSMGEVTVDGSGSVWTNGIKLYVGVSGSGTLNITRGGAVNNSDGYIGNASGSTGEVTVNGPGSTWTNNDDLSVGRSGSGTLNITDGGTVSNSDGYIGSSSGSTGEVTVDSPGSTWTSSNLYVGHYGSGMLNITGGGEISNSTGYIGYYSNSTGEVIVEGDGSTWTNSSYLCVGIDGSGTLNITDGGLVSVAGGLIIDVNADRDGFINMATGGMLALYGDADDSLLEFLGLIDGTDEIRYWDDSVSDWADITGATYGQDYMLSYLTEGDLAGYTLLTVPEPATLSLLVLGTATMLRRRRSAQGLN